MFISFPLSMIKDAFPAADVIITASVKNGHKTCGFAILSQVQPEERGRGFFNEDLDRLNLEWLIFYS